MVTQLCRNFGGDRANCAIGEVSSRLLLKPPFQPALRAG
jgi:hypothetical protein